MNEHRHEVLGHITTISQDARTASCTCGWQWITLDPHSGWSLACDVTDAHDQTHPDLPWLMKDDLR
jgi:hypothetical protein